MDIQRCGTISRCIKRDHGYRRYGGNPIMTLIYHD